MARASTVLRAVRVWCACAALLLLSAPARAQLAYTEVEGLKLVYVEPSGSYLVPHAARTFLNALRVHKQLFDYTPSEDITVLMLDFEDSGNASATSVPRNAVTVQVAPLSYAFETIAGNDRMNVIMNHELLHVVAMDQSSRRDRVWRGLFRGKVMPVAEQPESILYFFLTTPRVAAPRWFHEGTATFLDTWMAGGLGRAQGGYDEMVFRAMVKDGAHFYDPLGLASEGTKIDFQLQINSYLYGTRFMVWLARTYSPGHVLEWIGRREGSAGYYSRQFRQVFGTSLEAAWARWIADEQAFQRANLAAVRKYPITPHTDLTPRALGSVSRAHFDAATGRLYAGFNYPGVVAHVGVIDTASGEVDRLVNIKGPTVYTVTSLARDPATGTLFYTTDNGAWRDLVALDPATRKTRELQKDARIGDLAFNAADRSLWGVRQLNGMCSIVRIPEPWTDWERVHTFPYGTVVYDVDVSPDGRRLVASFGEITGKQDVRVHDIEALRRGDLTPVAQFDFGTAVPNNFVFSPDGRYLYGSSYYTGVSNIFRYEIETKVLEAVSNTETGFFRPIPLGGDELIVFRYSGQGWVPARIRAVPLQDIEPIAFFAERLVAEHPVVKTWSAGSPMQIPFDTMPARTGTYRLAGGLRTESLYPIVQGYKDSAAAGFRWNLSDRLQLNRLSVSASYSPDASLGAEERLHVAAEYQRFDWRVEAAYNPADFYDLFGPSKRGRKGFHALVGHSRTLVYDEPKRLELDVSGSVAADIDRLPDYQNVPVDVDRLYALEAVLAFTDVRRSLGSVDEEVGRKWSATLDAQVVDGTVVPRLRGTYDLGLPLPIPHSSLWFRNAAGYSTRDRDEPFANFFFGGFGNNYVDHRDEKRYRQDYSFPGAGINEISGRNYVKSMVEWTLPPWRFRRAGTPGFHATWLRPAVFVSGLMTDVDTATYRRTAASIGGQVDVQVSLLSALDLTLSAGAAVVVEDGVAPRREAMISLKILR